MQKIIKWVIIIGIIGVVGKALVNYIWPEATDLSSMVNMKKEELEETLGVTFTENPNKVKQIYEYSDGTITVESDRKNGIAIVYIDGKRAGLHIDNRKYGMYGLNIGDALISVDGKITFPYDESFEVLNDVVEGTSSAWFYCNTKKGDCMAVIFNEVSNRVVAMTYFSDGEKVTEQLTGPAW